MKAKVFLSVLFISASIVSIYAQENESKSVINYSNITEFGLITTSPRSVGIEGTSINGFSINQKHNIGVGIGFGGSFYTDYYTATAYTPVFFNYHLYFKPDKKFSPHFNIAAGGLLAKDGEGIYSSITAGFRAGKFSFSSGISFMAIYREEERYATYYDYSLYDPYSYEYSYKYISFQ
jgi:hypothetical protein